MHTSFQSSNLISYFIWYLISPFYHTFHLESHITYSIWFRISSCISCYLIFLPHCSIHDERRFHRSNYWGSCCCFNPPCYNHLLLLLQKEGEGWGIRDGVISFSFSHPNSMKTHRHAHQQKQISSDVSWVCIWFYPFL